MSLDQFFTPADACAVAYRSWETAQEGLRIGDFACGNGSLLEVAPFAKKKVFGLDIDPIVVKELRVRHPDWELHVGDFLKPDRRATRFLNPLKASLDLIVLNPPFSCRGGTKEHVEYEGEILTCSRAVAFLLKSLSFLKADGSAMAIMPKSVFRSEKDAGALRAIEREWVVDVKEEFSRTTFQGCYPHSVCVSLHRKPIRTQSDRKVLASPASSDRRVKIIRGCVPMYETAAAGPYRILHTTELRKPDPLGAIKSYALRPGRSVSGVFVTLARVGAPDLDKVRLVETKQPISLSDCVIALMPLEPSRGMELWEEMRLGWERLEARYASTCAPYLTIAQVKTFLHAIGWFVVEEDRSVTGPTSGSFVQSL